MNESFLILPNYGNFTKGIKHLAYYMNNVIDLIKILAPAGIVLYAMYLAIKSFLQKQNESLIINLRSKNKEIILPLRLQAFERMSLYLERIAPENLISRLSEKGQTAADLQISMLREIREEFNHNLAQQIYMSTEAWETIKTAKEEIVMVINQAYNKLDPNASGIDLAKSLLELRMNNKQDSLSYSLKFIKEEIQREF